MLMNSGSCRFRGMSSCRPGTWHFVRDMVRKVLDLSANLDT
jgi:hypothetical protein